ncbi:unnamed protein product, partial [Gulo gulo]
SCYLGDPPYPGYRNSFQHQHHFPPVFQHLPLLGWPGQPCVPEAQRDRPPHSCVLHPQHPPSCLGHDLMLEKLLTALSGEKDFTLCSGDQQGGVMLLLLQMNSCETGVSLLLPGLFMPAQVHQGQRRPILATWWMPFLPPRGYTCVSLGWRLALCTGNGLT